MPDYDGGKIKVKLVIDAAEAFQTLDSVAAKAGQGIRMNAGAGGAAPIPTGARQSSHANAAMNVATAGGSIFLNAAESILSHTPANATVSAHANSALVSAEDAARSAARRYRAGGGERFYAAAPFSRGYEAEVERFMPFSARAEAIGNLAAESIMAATQGQIAAGRREARFQSNLERASFAAFRQQDRNEARFQASMDAADFAAFRQQELAEAKAERERLKAARKAANAPGIMGTNVLSSGSYMSLLFGGWEVGTALRAVALADARAKFAPNEVAALENQVSGVEAATSGVLGSFVGLGWEGVGALTGGTTPSKLRLAAEEASFIRSSQINAREMMAGTATMRAASDVLRSPFEIERLERQKAVNNAKAAEELVPLQQQKADMEWALGQKKKVTRYSYVPGAGVSGTGGAGGGGIYMPEQFEEDVLTGTARSAKLYELGQVNDRIKAITDAAAAANEAIDIDIAAVRKKRELSRLTSVADEAYFRERGTIGEYQAGYNRIARMGNIEIEKLDLDDTAGRRAAANAMAARLADYERQYGIEAGYRSTLMAGSTAAGIARLDRADWRSEFAARRAEQAAMGTVNFQQAMKDIGAPGGYRNLIQVGLANATAMAGINAAEADTERARGFEFAEMQADVERNRMAAGGAPLRAAARRIGDRARNIDKYVQDPERKAHLLQLAQSELGLARAQIDEFYKAGTAQEISARRTDLSGTETRLGEDMTKLAAAIQKLSEAVAKLQAKAA